MAAEKHRLGSVRVNYTISAVPVTMLDLVWDRAAPLLKLPIDLSADELTLDSVYQRIKSGNTLLLTVSNGPDIIAVVTAEIRSFDTGMKALYLPLIGGTDMENWFDRMHDIAAAIAKDFDCQELRGIAVRKGWLRVLKDKGWSEVSTIVKYPLGGEK